MVGGGSLWVIDKYYQLDNMAIYVKSLVVYNSIKYYILDIFIDNIYTKQYNIKTNDEMNSSMVNEYCKLNDEGSETINLIFNKYKLSNRSYMKLLKVARTIADLDGENTIKSNHIVEAFSFRKTYYKYFEQR